MRIVTRLSQFRFESRLKTWAYRLAVNYILDVRKNPIQRVNLSFGRIAGSLVEGQRQSGVCATDTDRSILIEEVKVGCSLAMLQCLDRPHRIAGMARSWNCPGLRGGRGAGHRAAALPQAPAAGARCHSAVHPCALWSCFGRRGLSVSSPSVIVFDCIPREHSAPELRPQRDVVSGGPCARPTGGRGTVGAGGVSRGRSARVED